MNKENEMGYHIEAGEGYRILDREELVQEGDEYRDPADPDRNWGPSDAWRGKPQTQDPCFVYRRKVADTPAPLESPANILSSLPDPNAPKPFTPNKYTRYIPTLDGRLVPVDVYCVSSAFDLGACGFKDAGALEAVLHARKKILAPGQRAKASLIQDIKEAHASLGRAIALEEAALGREA